MGLLALYGHQENLQNSSSLKSQKKIYIGSDLRKNSGGRFKCHLDNLVFAYFVKRRLYAFAKGIEAC